MIFLPEPIPVFYPNRLRFLVVDIITGALLALAIGVLTATTGLRILTLPRALATRASTLRTSLLRLGTSGATASQSGVSPGRTYKEMIISTQRTANPDPL